jgi:hypothetical protein
MFKNLLSWLVLRIKEEKGVIVFLGYLVITILLTYPLIISLKSSVFGFTSDNFGTIWHFWVQGSQNSEGITDLIRYPLGVKLESFHPEIGWSLPFMLMSILVDEVVVFNLFVILSFILSAFTMYLLIYYLTKDRLTSFLIGFIFSFAPYHFWQGFTHFNLGFLYTLPVFMLALLEVDRKKTLKSGLLLGVAFLFTITTSSYYGLFVVFLSFGFLGGQVLISAFQKKNYLSWPLLKSLGVAALLPTVVLSPLIFQVFINKSSLGISQTLPTRPINDLLSLSMRPWDFLLPAPNHPFLGQWADSLLLKIKAMSADFKTISAFLPERVLYLGVGVFSATILAVGGLLRAKKHRHLLAVLLVTLLVILFFSAPPFIIVGGKEIRFPTYYLYPYLTFIRVYSRLGILALMVILVILALGLQQIKSKNRKLLVLSALLIITFFEYLPFGWNQATSLKLNDLYTWVKDQPQDRVFAEYPLDFDTADSLIWQTQHGKRLYNDIFSDEFFPIKTELPHLEDPATWLKLGAIGVDYVIFHTNPIYENKNPVNEFYLKAYTPSPIKSTFVWAKEVMKFEGAVVYAPVGKQAKAVRLAGDEETTTWLLGVDWSWSDEDNVIFVYNPRKETVTASYEYSLKEGNISKEEIRAEQVDESRVISLEPGMNQIIFTNANRNQVTLSDFKIKVLPTQLAWTN